MDLSIIKQIIFIAMLTALLPLYIIITIKGKTEDRGLGSIFPDLLMLIITFWMAFDSLIILYEKFN